MSSSLTTRMIAMYSQMAEPMRFFSGMFMSPPRNMHTSEEVEVDITRGGEEVAVVVQDLSVGHRMNSEDLYTNKRFKPPVYKEAFPINSHDLLKRVAGQNPFESPDFRANVIERMFRGMLKIESKIRRAVELQASQVLQTGKLTLTNSSGEALYELDYKPKATHFPTAGTSWASATGAQKIKDLTALGEIVRNDGLGSPNELYMGIDAFENFISDEVVRDRLDTRRIDLGGIAPMPRGMGATFQGWMRLGNYRYDIYTYDGRYEDPQTKAKTPYLDPGKVVVRDGMGRLDVTFGAVPNIGALLGGTTMNMLPELPGRMSNMAGGMDLFTNVWLSPNGEQLFGGCGARPLMQPTAIDTFGCLDTGL